MSESGNYYVIYPYLRTKEPFTIGGITYKSSDSIRNEEEADQHHLKLLLQNFYMGHEVRIKRAIYTKFPWTQDAKGTDNFSAAAGSHRLLSYLAGSFFPCEYSTAFALFPQKVRRNKHRAGAFEDLEFEPSSDGGLVLGKSGITYVPGYRLYLNFKHHSQVFRNQRIYPAYGELRNYPMDLGNVIHKMLDRPENWALRQFTQIDPRKTKPDNTERRILRAIGWYNQSCISVAGQEECQVVALATAFEALFDHDFSDMVKEGEPERFDKEPGAITPKFFLTLHTLLGHIERLDLWAEQFYSARSKIVHTGRAAALRFSPERERKKKSAQAAGKDTEEPPMLLGGLDEIGKQVFQLCLAAMLAGHEHAKVANIGAKLVHNRERLQSICRILDMEQAAEVKLRDVLPILRELQTDNVSISDTTRMVQYDLLLGASGRFLGLLLELPIEWSPSEKVAIEDARSSTPQEENGVVMQRFDALREIMTDDAIVRLEDDSRWEGVFELLSGFLDFVSLSLLVGVLVPEELRGTVPVSSSGCAKT